MTEQQLSLAIGAPMLFNAVLIGLLMAYMNATNASLDAKLSGRMEALDGKLSGRMDALDAKLSGRMDANEAQLGHVDARLANFDSRINQRFDDMRDLWRSELHRVEEVLDARLKHLEESR